MNRHWGAASRASLGVVHREAFFMLFYANASVSYDASQYTGIRHSHMPMLMSDSMSDYCEVMLHE